MSGIFISYRREETAAYAGRLRDRLIQEFGADQVFMDVDTIDLGVDFTEVIEKAVSDVDVLLCVMGSEWASLTDERGRRRLDDPTDFVRLEVASALERNIRIIPVLVKGAKMPSADQLPPDLSALVKRNALQLGHERFHSDADRLVQSLQRLTNQPSRARAQRKSKAMPLGKWLAAALFLFVIAGGAWYIWDGYQGDQRRIAEQRVAEAKAKLEAQREAELETRRRAEAEAELEAQREAELEVKRRADAEAKREAEAEARRKAQREAELEARRQAEVDARRRARAEAARAQQQYDDVQKLYGAHKSTEDCTRIRRIVAGIERYYSESYPVPEDKRNTVRYPRQIEQPTISNLARDRIIRIRRAKAHCF